MRNWTAGLDALLGELDRNLRGAVKRVRATLGESPLEVICYRGFANADAAVVLGRVVASRRVGPSSAGDSALRNLLNTYRRVDSDPVPFAELAIEYAGAATTVRADDEGFFEATLTLPPEAANREPGDEWSSCRTELLAPTRTGGAIGGRAELLRPPRSATLGVISDIDDTVIQSRVSSFLLAARTLAMENARTRLPFPGVAAFYRALRDGASGSDRNPVFYVSSSPWNVYDVITEFMELQGLPRGPVLLRDWDITFGALSSSRHFDHKGAAIRRILTMYPRLPFILIGDTSQHDPEIYRRIVSEFPGRIRAVYIRDVNLDEARSTAVRTLADEIRADGSALVLAEDTLGPATHAAEAGWISAAALPFVREDKLADEGATDEKVAANPLDPSPG